jgi:hypothetical protein
MQGHNPIVKQTTLATLNSMINVLQYLTSTFDQFDVDYDDFDDDTLLNTSDINGLCCIIHCVKDAAATCYAQYSAEKNQGSK